MKEKLLQRLKQLKHEHQLGKKTLDDLETKQFSLRETLLRISGAIQVLEELLDDPEQPDDKGAIDSSESEMSEPEESP